MKRVYTLIVFILLPLLAMAQANFKKGLVVTAGGDTLRGYINFREWRNSPAAIAFSTMPGGQAAQQFTPANSRYFEVSGLEAYKRYQGPISIDQVTLNNLSAGTDTSKTTATVFMKVLATGKNLSLFAYTDNIKTRYFLEEIPEEKMYELGYRKYFKETNGGRKINLLKLYPGQLVAAASKYGPVPEALKQRIFSADYSASDLAAVVDEVNGAEKATPEKTAAHSSAIRFFAGAGITRITSKFTGSSDFVKSSGHHAVFAPTFSLGLDAFPNPNTQRLFFRATFSYTGTSNFSYHKKQNRLYSSISYNDLSYSFSQKTVSATPQVLYNFYAKGNLKIFAGGGAVFNASSYGGNVHQDTYVINSEQGVATAPLVTKNYLSFEKFWVSFPVQAGLALFNKAEVSLGYTPPMPISEAGAFDLRESSVQAHVHYYLNR